MAGLIEQKRNFSGSETMRKHECREVSKLWSWSLNGGKCESLVA